MTALLFILVFGVVALAVFMVGSLLEQRGAQSRLIRERLAQIQEPAEKELAEENSLVRDELLSNIPAFNNLLRRSDRVSNLQKTLQQADINMRAGNFLALCVASAIVVGTFAGAAAQMFPLVWAGAFVGFILPYSYANYKRGKRFQKFEEIFPHAVDTLARAVRAGHAFTTALELIATELAEPVAGEFRQLFEEQKFGRPVRDALMNLVDRVPLVDVKFFVTAVMLQRETGGNLAEILDNLSYMIRERFKIQRQVRVYTAQGRLTMVLLMSLPPAIIVLMLFMSPGFIKPLFTDPLGHVLVVAGITLQTLGYFIIRKIVQIQV